MPRVIHCVDGRVRVLHFATEDAALIERDTQRVLAEEPGATYEDVDVLPSRRFRAAWTRGANGVTVDVQKARLQRVAEIRAERDKALAATDGPFLRDSEMGKDVSALKATRQALRDLPAKAMAELAECVTADDVAAYEVRL